jgi:eukaryotic-like serine/threonine-protein kinase
MAVHSTILPAGLEIGHRYRVVRLLGQGGMGAVYQVYDLELERDAALKLIRPELGADPQVLVRFKREIQLSSQVTHPNVLRVYDLGESGGTKFLTMQFVEGEDLATKLKRDGRLPLDDLLDKFRQICQVLPPSIVVDMGLRLYETRYYSRIWHQQIQIASDLA